MYIRRFKEADSLKELTDVKLIDKIIKFFEENPYPQDHNGFHKFVEELGLDAGEVEPYVYAIVSCFISGGNFVKSKKKESDFPESELKSGVQIEYEHIDVDNDNPVIKKISEYIAKRISLDHLVESDEYYIELAKMENKF